MAAALEVRQCSAGRGLPPPVGAVADCARRPRPYKRASPSCNLPRMTLSSEEVERYARQIVLRGVGGPGQNKLKARARRSSSAQAASARRRCNISRARASGRSGSSTTTRSRFPTCTARSSTEPATSGGRRRRARRRRSAASIRMSRSRRWRCGSTPRTPGAMVSALRRRARRIGQFRHPLRPVRRLLL